jgi:N utilization substance protein B
MANNDGKKLTRREMREAAFLLLYQLELAGAGVEDLAETMAECVEAFGLEANSASVKLASGVLENKDAIDALITKYSPTRKIGRMAKINLVIMRIALYEMDYADETPDKVAVNEAIELSKKYALDADSKLISGLLGSYFREKNVGHDALGVPQAVGADDPVRPNNQDE